MDSNQDVENIQDLIGDSRYIPFLHRITESWLSITVKWIANFIIAVIDFINLPSFVILALLFYQQVMQLRDPDFKIPLVTFENLLWFFGAWLLIRFLVEKTMKNITSPTVLPVWFMNSKGVLKNAFYSVEKAQKYSADLDMFVQSQADEYIRQKVRATEHVNQQLFSLVNRMSELSDFPNETYESLRRTVEFLADAILDPENVRHQYNVILDRIMNEISTTKPIQKHIKYGSIMLLDEDGMLRIGGQLNLPNRELSKEIPLGERFAGKVVAEGQFTWVPDVNTEEAKRQYDFIEDTNRSYVGIIGFPIRSQDGHHIGVICLQFTEVDWQESELKVISKTLEVYAEIIISAIKLRGIQERFRNN